MGVAVGNFFFFSTSSPPVGLPSRRFSTFPATPCLVLFSPGGYINSARFPYLDPVGNPTFYCGIYRKGQLKMGYRPDGACRSIPALNKFSWVEFFFNFSSRIQRFLSKPSRKNYHLPIFLVDGALKSQTPRFRIGGTSHLATC